MNIVAIETATETVGVAVRSDSGAEAALPPGAAPVSRDAVLARLAWSSPRRASAQRKLVEALLDEANTVGVTSAGGLTSYGRAVLADAPTAARDAVAIS